MRSPKAPLRDVFLALLVLVVAGATAFAADSPQRLVLGETAHRRVALVLGNAAYQHAPALANPVRDAEAMRDKLESLGFDVIAGFDLTKMETQETIARFAKSVRGAEIGLLFYAGHGMQVSGSNYLLPVDAALEDETSIDFEVVPIDFILRQMARETAVRLVFLDACRDNPLAKILAETDGSDRVSGGLAELQIENKGAGTLIAFATSPNEVAYDGTGDHSPFSKALVARIGAENVPLSTAMTQVTGDVYKATGGKQRPWVNVSLTDEVVLNRVVKAEPEPAPVVAATETDSNSESRTAGAGIDDQASNDAEIALNILRQQIPKLETTGPILFDQPITFGESALDGKSISQLIGGKPLYSPIEGLEKAAWDTTCASCHQWTRERLCEQSRTYEKVDVSIMRLQHPYGSKFKVALANWAHNGCK